MSSPAPPKVTAIVSTYASARFLRGCLDDLIAQSLYAQGALEILVIDSGSPENESAIVAEYQQRHANIRLHRTAREPLYAAWNRAIGLACGTYLTNANTDDRHRPDALELLANHLDASPETSVVYADSLISTQPNETWEANTASERLGWPTFSYEELKRRCIVGPQPMWRKSLHERWGLFDASFRIAGDYEFWLRIGKSERIDRYPATLGLYYRNPQGLEHGSGVTVAETQEIQRRYNQAPMSAVAVSQNVRPATVQPLPAAAAAAAAAAAQNVQPAATKAKAPPPLVSVIVPTYNRPEFLARALGTLSAQTFTDFEVVVINDCGGPLEGVLQNFEGRLNITYLRHGVNRDRAAARNSGIRVARGKYIAYLDDDDGYRPNHLELLINGLRTQGGSVVYSQAEWMHEEKTATGYRPGKIAHEPYPAFNRDRLLVQNYIPVLSLMHERACLDEVGMFDEELGTHEDWDLFIRLANRYRVVHVPVITADVSVRSDGSSTTSGKREDFLRTLKLIHSRYRDFVGDRPDILEAQARFLAAAAPGFQSKAEPDVYDKAYQWGWEHPQLKEIVYLCYKTPNFSDNARRFFDSAEFKAELEFLRGLGQGPAAGVKLLDVGCGNGVASYALARSGYEVVGIDSSNGELAGVRAAQKLQGLDGAQFQVMCTSSEKLAFPDASFNVVWMREVLHHIKDLNAFLREAHRVLRPGGVICCFRDTVIWNENQRKDFFDKHPFFHITKDEGAYYLHEYRAAFRAAGFVEERELNPVESVINTFPGPCTTNARYDEAAAQRRQGGYDLFSFFYRKPNAVVATTEVDSSVEAALRRFNDFQARLGAGAGR